MGIRTWRECRERKWNWKWSRVLASGAAPLVLLLWANVAQSVDVILDGDTVIRIENLPVIDPTTQEATYYNVDFVFNDAVAVYGEDLDFDFTTRSDAGVALATVLDALNENVPVPERAGPESYDQFFIGAEIENDFVVSVGGEEFVGLWDQCDTDCALGVSPPRSPDFLQTWADFTPVDEIPRPTVEFSADPEAIEPGGSSRLSWSAEDADLCNGWLGSPDWPGPKDPIEGTQVVTPEDTSTYLLVCQGPGGFTGEMVTVTVGTPTPTGLVVSAIATGSDVLFLGEGTLGLAAWSNAAAPTDDSGRIDPSSGDVVVGPPSNAPVDRYQDAENLTGPSSFGSGGEALADSGMGDLFGILASAEDLIVPQGYTSGSELSGESTYEGETLDSLGLQVGNYKWTWGSDGTASSYTLMVVPEPHAAPMLLAVLTSLGLVRRHRRREG